MPHHKESTDYESKSDFFKLFVKAQGKYPANSFKEAAYITIFCRTNYGYVPDFKSASDAILDSKKMIEEIGRIAGNAHQNNSLAETVIIDREILAFIFIALRNALELANDLKSDILHCVLDDDFSFLNKSNVEAAILKGARSNLLEFTLREYLRNS